MKKYIFILVFALSVFSVSGNTKHEMLLDSANTHYNDGQYHKAVESYLAIIEDGMESTQVYYNLGNAYFKLDDLASAILYYEKAKKLSPNDKDIEYNLGIANTRIVDKIEKVPQIIFKRWWNSFYNMFSANNWGIVAIVLFILTLVFFAIYLLSRARIIKKGFFILAVIFVLLSFSSFLLTYQKYYYSKNQKEAILFAPTMTVKSSPNRNSVDLFVIHEGTKIHVLDQVGEWIEIRIANGSVGWLPVSEIRYI